MLHWAVRREFGPQDPELDPFSSQDVEWEAALGDKLVVPTPDGKVDLKIPANAKSGQKMRLKGKGIPGHPPGDLYASLQIVNPRVSTEQAREMFQKMAQEMPFDPRENLRRKGG